MNMKNTYILEKNELNEYLKVVNHPNKQDIVEIRACNNEIEFKLIGFKGNMHKFMGYHNDYQLFHVITNFKRQEKVVMKMIYSDPRLANFITQDILIAFKQAYEDVCDGLAEEWNEMTAEQRKKLLDNI